MRNEAMIFGLTVSRQTVRITFNVNVRINDNQLLEVIDQRKARKVYTCAFSTFQELDALLDRINGYYNPPASPLPTSPTDTTEESVEETSTLEKGVEVIAYIPAKPSKTAYTDGNGAFSALQHGFGVRTNSGWAELCGEFNILIDGEFEHILHNRKEANAFLQSIL